MGVGARQGREWVVRAQDGHAPAVLAETARALAGDLDPVARCQALYARALALYMLDDETAVGAAGDLVTLTVKFGLVELNVQGEALLVVLLAQAGRTREAVEALAEATALEVRLVDVSQPEVQAAVGALAVAHRQAGLMDEARRLEARLDSVQHELPLHQRVGRLSNLAIQDALTAMAQAQLPPHEPDHALLDRAVAGLEHGSMLAGESSYAVVHEELAVVRGLRHAALDDPGEALKMLDGAATVLGRGSEAWPAQLLWAAARVRALVRLRRPWEATVAGRRVLDDIPAGRAQGARAALLYELLRAEHPDCERPQSPLAQMLARSRERAAADAGLITALFSARVDLLRGEAERRLLTSAAMHDPLTGLPNRRAAELALTGAVQRDHDAASALLLVDVDGFKAVNDSQGHLVGDEVLVKVAGALRKAARTRDLVARWGGDEFVVLARVGGRDAKALADRLRSQVRDLDIDETGRPITVSVGIAVRRRGDAMSQWLGRADAAMYAAKRRGGDAWGVRDDSGDEEGLA